MKRQQFLQLLTLTSCLAGTGCASVPPDWKKHLPWTAEARIKESAFEKPTHMVAIWSPDILTQPGKPPTRGFGGRIYFYNDKNQAIPVEGQLVVYGYDESAPRHPNGDPDRKYAFTPEQFRSHYSASDLGASYSVWVPWDAAGGQQTNISLVPVFTSSSGQIVMGQQVRNVLPGKKPELAREEPPASAISRVLPATSLQTPSQHLRAEGAVAYQQASPEPAAAEPRLKTSTITIPRSMQLRLQQAPSGGLLPAPLPAATGSMNAAGWNVIHTTSQRITEPGPASQVPTANPQAPPPASPLTSPAGESPRARSERPQFPVRAMPGAPAAHVAGEFRHAPAIPRSAPASPAGLNSQAQLPATSGVAR